MNNCPFPGRTVKGQEVLPNRGTHACQNPKVAKACWRSFLLEGECNSRICCKVSEGIHHLPLCQVMP